MAALIGIGFVEPANAASGAEAAGATQAVQTVAADSLPTPQVDGVVWKQIVVGDTVYVGGQFDTARPDGVPRGGAGTVVRKNFLAYSLKTGELLPFAPAFNSQVRSLAVSPDGKRLYVGGTFSVPTTAQRETDATAYVERYRLAAFDLPSLQLVKGFNPSLNATVRSIAATNSSVYVGGVFTSVNKTGRTSGTAALAAADGKLLPWEPRLDVGASVQSIVVSPDEKKIVIGGTFQSVNGSDPANRNQPGYGMGAVDAATGASVGQWKVGTVVRNARLGVVMDLKSDGTSVYGVGTAGGAGGEFEGAFRASWTDGTIEWLEDCHGDSYAVAPTADVVYAVSHSHDCENIGGFGDYVAPEKHYRALAFTNKATGAVAPETGGYPGYAGQPAPSLLNFFPSFNIGEKTGQGPWDVVAAQGFVLIGGEFSRVNGDKHEGLARFAPKSMAPNDEGPRLSGADMPITTVPLDGTSVKLSWPTNYDRDDASLRYQVIRDGDTANPVSDVSVSSRFYARTTVRALDTGLTPGVSYSYQVRSVDAAGNSTMSASVTYTATAGAGMTATAYDDAVLGDNPALYWPLNETSGTIGYDVVGRNDLREIGARSAGSEAAGAGQAWQGNGTNAWAASMVPIDGPQVYSAEMWIKTTSKKGGVLLGFSAGRVFDGVANDRHVYMDAAGRLHFANYDGTVKLASSTKSYNDGGWHHVVSTLGPKGIQLFVDGALVASRADSTSAAAYVGHWTVGAHQIAGRPNAPESMYFGGAIDNVAIYDRVLTAGEIAAHHAFDSEAVNRPPVAAFTSSASGLGISVDGSTSSDPDGPLASYAWEFGDGSTATGAKATHSFVATGTYTVRLTVTDALGLTARTEKSVTVAAPGVIAADDFARTAVGGWGAAAVGGAWKPSGGNAGFSVTQPTGRIAGSPGETRTALLSSVAAASSDSSVSFVVDGQTTGGGQYVSVVGRHVDGQSYSARVRIQGDGTMQLQVMRGGTSLKALNLPGSYAAGTAVHLRLQVSGLGTSALKAKAWTVGNEPTEWQVTATDTSAALQKAGAVGLGLYVSSSGAASTVAFSSYSVKLP